MKALVLSDSHGSFQSIMNAVESEKDISLIIFAGDIQRDADDIAAAYPDIPFEYVLGNNDWYVNDVPYDRLFEFSGKRIFLTHGHRVTLLHEGVAGGADMLGHGDHNDIRLGENLSLLVAGIPLIFFGMDPAEKRKRHITSPLSNFAAHTALYAPYSTSSGAICPQRICHFKQKICIKLQLYRYK